MHEIIKIAREYKGVFTLKDINSGLEISLSNNSTNNKQLDSSSNNNSKPASNILDSIVQPIISYDPNSLLNCAHDYPHQFDTQMDHSESMIDNNNIHTTETQSSLKDLLIKTNSKVENNLSLSSNLSFYEFKKLKTMFSHENSLNNRNKKKVEKINEIKNSINNQLEIYLPRE